MLSCRFTTVLMSSLARCLLVIATSHSFLQTVDCCTDGGSWASRERPASPSNCLPTLFGLAFPDTIAHSFHVLLAAERAEITITLLHFVTLHNLPDGRAIACTILASDANLLGVLGHCYLQKLSQLTSGRSVPTILE